MARRARTRQLAARSEAAAAPTLTASADELFLAAVDRGGDTSQTGRFLVTFKEGAADAGAKALTARRGLRVADAREFDNQAMDLAATGDAQAVMFPEIGVALVGGAAASEHGITAAEFTAADSAAHSVDPNTSCSRRR